MTWHEQAAERLNREIKDVKGQKEGAMKSAVVEALLTFCMRDEEFAQAVVQGGSFADCMTAVAKGVGNSISDISAYRKAAQFYFPGAKIRVEMSIDLIGDARQDAAEPRGILLDLADFF